MHLKTIFRYVLINRKIQKYAAHTEKWHNIQNKTLSILYL